MRPLFTRRTRQACYPPAALALLGVTLLLCAPAAAAPADPLEGQHRLSMELETAHTDWAQPYAGERTRVLYFSSPRDTHARDIIELMQRFDVRAEAVYWDQRGGNLLGEQKGHERLGRLLEKEYDCYLVSAVPAGALTDGERKKILQCVRQGAGLVTVGRSWPEVMTDGNRLDGTGGRTYRIADGRACFLPGPDNPGYEVGWQVKYDRWQERLGRAVLWAAGHEPSARLDVAFSSTELSRSDLPASAVTVSWRSAPTPSRLVLRMRRSDGRIIDRHERDVRDRDGQARCEVPVTREDLYHVAAWIRDDRGTVTWGTGSFRVVSPRSVNSVDLAADWGEVGDRIAGTVQLARPPGGSERLRVDVVGHGDRVLRRAFPEVPGETAQFSFPVKEWMPMLLRVEASVLEGDDEVSQRHAWFHVTRRQRGRFHFLVWDFPGGVLAPYAERQLAELGATLQLSGGNPPRVVAACGLSWVPYTTRILARHDDRGVMEPACWNDGPRINEHVNHIASTYRKARRHGVFAYSLGDEVDTRGSCLHPACMKAYRRYLKQAYGSIGALNESWGSKYGSFDGAELLDPGDNDARKAREAGNYPRWYDRQAFKCYNQVQLCRRFARRYRELDPRALTGFEGAGRIRNGADFDLLVRSLDFWSPYPWPGDEIIRSISPPGFITGNWMGYSKDAPPLLRRYWRMVLRGKNVVQWWRWDSCGNRGGEFAWHGLLMPDLAPYPAVKKLVEETGIVRRGLGDLLMRSTMQDDHVVMLYSHPSVYASQLQPGSSFGRYPETHAAWHTLIRQAGLQFRYVTDAMLRRGEFDPDDCRVLVLPRVEAMGDRESELIREFVRQGGTVLADVRPGLYDGHLKPRPSGVLDDLFGIERGEPSPAATTPIRIEGAQAGEQPGFTLEKVRHDPAVRLTTGAARGSADGTPVAITRKVGEGRAVLLNFTLWNFPDLSSAGAEEVAGFFEDLFYRAGATPAVPLTADGGPARDTEVVRWRNGDLRILALSRVLHGRLGGLTSLQAPSDTRTVVMELPRPMHLYTLGDSAHRGRGREFRVQVGPVNPTFCVAAPEPLREATIGVTPSAVARGRVPTVAVRVPDAQGTHALRIRVHAPDGSHVPRHDRVVLVGTETTRIDLPVAFNDPRGEWTVRAVDLYTDRAAAARLTVR